MIDVLQRYCEVNLNPGLVGLVDYVNGIDDAGGCPSSG
jgi:hypothetical protein